MKILYLCHRIPYPPNKGEKIRAFHQLKALSSRHEVDLFTLSDQPLVDADQQALKQYCRRVSAVRMHPLAARMRSLSRLLSRRPLTLPYFYSDELYRKVREAILLHGYDRIFVYCSAMAQYVDWVRDKPIFADLVDVDSDKWEQYAAFTSFPMSAIYGSEAKRLREYERKVCRRSKCVIVTTEREAALIREIAPGAAVEVIPNGVDTAFFKPAGYPDGSAPAIVFTGDMSYFPNEDAVVGFARRVLPLVRKEVPDARFLIVGRDPTRKVRRLGNIAGVEVTGFVPDVRPWLERASVAVAPFSIAAGIQNKVLEALAYCRPVVASRKALQGVSTPVAEVIGAGESPEELAAWVLAMLKDPTMASQIGKDGRRQVTSEYNWQRSGEQLLSLIENPQIPVRTSSPTTSAQADGN